MLTYRTLYRFGFHQPEYLARIYQALKFTLSSNALESKSVNLDQYLEPGALLKTFPLGFDTQGTLNAASFNTADLKHFSLTESTYLLFYYVQIKW